MIELNMSAASRAILPAWMAMCAEGMIKAMRNSVTLNYRFVGIVVEPDDGDFDESLLPLYVFIDLDGEKVVMESDMLPKLGNQCYLNMHDYVGGVFNVARSMGFEGPADLLAYGTSRNEEAFMSGIRDLVQLAEATNEATPVYDQEIHKLGLSVNKAILAEVRKRSGNPELIAMADSVVSHGSGTALELIDRLAAEIEVLKKRLNECQ